MCVTTLWHVFTTSPFIDHSSRLKRWHLYVASAFGICASGWEPTVVTKCWFLITLEPNLYHVWITAFPWTQRNLVIPVPLHIINTSILVSGCIIFLQVHVVFIVYKAYSGFSTIKHQHHLCITEDAVSLSLQKRDALVPVAMFVFLVLHLAEAAPSQVVAGCQKPG